MKNISNFFSYAVGDFFVKGVLFISLPLLTRIMSPEQYGKLSLINAAVLIMYVFISLNLQNAVLNRFMINKVNFNQYLSTCVIFLVPFHVVIYFTLLCLSHPLSMLLGVSEEDFKWIIIICILLSYMYIYTSYLQASEQGGRFVIFNIFNKLGELFLIFIFAISIKEQKYLSKIYAQILICVPFVIYAFYKLRAMLEMRFCWKDLQQALCFGIPLIVHVLSNALLAQADRIILSNKLGNEAAGIYSFAYNLGMAISIIIMAWNSSWQPRLFIFIRESALTKINIVNKYSTLFIIMVSVIFMLFSKEMVLVMSNEDYYKSIDLIPVVVLGNTFIHIYLIYVNFVFYKKKTFFISIATMIALAINILMNYLLIPVLGLEGAAWSTVIAYAFLCIIHYLNALMNVSTEVKECIKIKYFISGGGALIVAYLLTNALNNIPVLVSLLIKLSFASAMIIYVIVRKLYQKLVIS